MRAVRRLSRRSRGAGARSKGLHGTSVTGRTAKRNPIFGVREDHRSRTPIMSSSMVVFLHCQRRRALRSVGGGPASDVR